MTATEHEVQIVPFGKYRGRPFTDLIADRSYVNWLLAQPKFPRTQPTIYNLIVNSSASEPQDTPEHNAMQARFLDPSLRLALGRRYLADEAYLRQKQPTLGADAVTDLTVTEPKFEVRGWDVTFRVHADMRHPDEPSRGIGIPLGEHDDFACLSLELKPTIADEFPSVLRQVVQRREDQNRNGWGARAIWVVVTDRLEPSSVSPVEVRTMFASRKVDLVLSRDIR